MADEFDFEGGDTAPTVPLTGLTMAELATATGFNLKRLEQMIRNGMPVAAKPGATKRSRRCFDLPAVIGWLASGEQDPMTAAKQRKAVAEAERMEFQNRKAAGDLVSLKEVRGELAEGMALLRNNLLAISARMTNQTDEVRAEVKAAIIDGVNSFSISSSGGFDEAP
jgi:phage terminase Nu1 subunit (DNA packaging protein)